MDKKLEKFVYEVNQKFAEKQCEIDELKKELNELKQAMAKKEEHVGLNATDCEKKMRELEKRIGGKANAGLMNEGLNGLKRRMDNVEKKIIEKKDAELKLNEEELLNGLQQKMDNMEKKIAELKEENAKYTAGLNQELNKLKRRMTIMEKGISEVKVVNSNYAVLNAQLDWLRRWMGNEVVKRMKEIVGITDDEPVNDFGIWNSNLEPDYGFQEASGEESFDYTDLMENQYSEYCALTTAPSAFVDDPSFGMIAPVADATTASSSSRSSNGPETITNSNYLMQKEKLLRAITAHLSPIHQQQQQEAMNSAQSAADADQNGIIALEMEPKPNQPRDLSMPSADHSMAIVQQQQTLPGPSTSTIQQQLPHHLNQQQQPVPSFYISIDREQDLKFETLCDLYETVSIDQAVIFCSTRKNVDNLARSMQQKKFTISILYDEMEEFEQSVAIREFSSCSSRVLITTDTDLISHGVGVQNVSVVINYDLPGNWQNYISRIGNFRRFGRKRMVIFFLTKEDQQKLSKLESYFSTKIEEMPANIGEFI